MTEESDAMPLGDSDLTASERKALRGLLRDQERASWAWKRLRVLVPAVVAVVVALWHAWDWAVKHLKVTP